jgi:sensor histidine kinase YesM
MSFPTLPNLPAPAALRNPSSGFAAHLLRAILIASGCALLVVALFLSLGRFRLPETGRVLLFAFTYCALIALPSFVILTFLSVRYTARFPRLIVLAQALVLVCLAIAGSFAAGLVFQILHLVPRQEFWAEFRFSAPFSVVVSLMFGLSISAFETMRYKLQAATLEARTRQVEQERAYKLLAEAQLSSLESRIHPHFLFNTLNSIAALIPSDPQKAEDTVGKLASLLRFSLTANHSGTVPLLQELKIVRDYLEIEKTRFGARLRYEIAVPESLGEAQVPPLALQSLVENAVKHVVAQRTEGATIQVRGFKLDGAAGPVPHGSICLEVLDDGPGFSLDAIRPEHGLGNLTARLELLFGEDGRLEVARQGSNTAVRLLFPASSLGSRS